MKRISRILSTLVLAALMMSTVAAPTYAAGPEGFKPSQIRRAYGISRLAYDGAGQTIAIIGAFDYPNATADLAVFNKTFGLASMNGLPDTQPCTVAAGPYPCFEAVKVESANQDAPLFWSGDSTWAKEMSANIQWAHAMAPGANILLMKANTNQLPDLVKAVDQAVDSGASVVSMSWGFVEEAGHVDWNSHFTKPGVLFVAAAGNNGTDLMFPAASPNVLAVGGTYLNMKFDGTYKSETVYNNGVGGSVGGLSKFQPAPAWHQEMGFASRSVPDLAWGAGFAGYAVYTDGKWRSFGGTSTAAPQVAAMIALVNQAKGSAFTDIGKIYEAGRTNQAKYFNDVTVGVGACQTAACAATAGYDIATGWGSPKADALVPFLAGLPTP